MARAIANEPDMLIIVDPVDEDLLDGFIQAKQQVTNALFASTELIEAQGLALRAVLDYAEMYRRWQNYEVGERDVNRMHRSMMDALKGWLR